MKNIICCLLIYSLRCCVSIEVTKSVPANLSIGAGTSSYQVEGGWNEDGKGENVFDRLVHTNPGVVLDRSNGDVACDSYHKIDIDVAMLKSIGFQFYRFSISWARILPRGHSGPVNEKGVEYYNRLINALIANKIEPVITIYHWDHPQVLQDLGGWTSPEMVKWFTDYADVVLSKYADRVKFWITLNEPNQICRLVDPNGLSPPGIKANGFPEYLCARHILLAHAKVYRLYKKKYENGSKGRVCLAIDGGWYEPATNSRANRMAAQRAIEFGIGIYAHPIFSADGDFPPIVKELVADRSRAEGFNKSRLPEFTRDEIELIHGSADLYCLNYYTSFYAKEKVADPIGLPSKDSDTRVDVYQSPCWLTGSFNIFRSVPWGFRKLLNYIKHYYDKPIFISENGFPDYGELNDEDRLTYSRDNIGALLDAVNDDGVSVVGYTHWSIMDNWEWLNGYVYRFGIYYVNFTDPDRPRTPKLSSKFFKVLIKNRRLILEE